MYTVTITEKGQIVIPSKIRKRMNIKKGTKIIVKEEGNEIHLIPTGPERIEALRGIFARKGQESVTDYLLKERTAEMEREDKKWKR